MCWKSVLQLHTPLKGAYIKQKISAVGQVSEEILEVDRLKHFQHRSEGFTKRDFPGAW